MKMQEVRARAKRIGINPGDMKKTGLIRAIQSAEGNTPCFQTGAKDCDQTDCCWRDDCRVF